MKRQLLPALLLFFATAVILFLSIAGHSRRARANSDLPPAKRTGAPTENTCATCHNGGANDGQGTLAIVNAPATYTPGQAYALQVTLTRPGQVRWGFELTCVKVSDGTGAGSLTNTTQFTGTQVSSGRTYISHTTLNAGYDGTFFGTANGPVTWSFEWTAPPAQTGDVQFYAAGVAADGSGDPDAGDFVYTTSVSSAEEPSTAVEPTTWGKIKVRYR